MGRNELQAGHLSKLEPGNRTDGLAPDDRIVVSRIDGLIPGTVVRTRMIDAASGRPLSPATAAPADG